MATTKKYTDTRGKIEFDHIGIGTALSRYLLKVPVNQREYSWEERHILDLLHDFTNAIRTNKASYFLGTVVLTDNDGGPPEVADGQQRLATTTILLAAIRDYLSSRGEDVLANSVENDFLFKIIRETKEISPRLSLNVDDNEFFRKRILSKPDSTEREIEATKASHKRIETANKLVSRHIEDTLKTLSDSNKISHINQWLAFIENIAQVIILKVQDDLNAYVMFETLNDRGLKTSQADLLKNYLFGEAGTRIDEAQQKWAKMAGALESAEIEDITMTYLRHLVSSIHGLTREREVFERIKSVVAGRGQAIEFLDILADNANDYVAILNPNHSKWNDYNIAVRNNIKTINTLQVVQIRPLMLAVARHFSLKETVKALRLFVSWSVRFLIVGGGRGGRLEDAYSERAKDITSGKTTTTAQLISSMAKIVPSDTQFETEFANARVSKSHLARYYLRTLELTARGSSEPEFIPNEDIVVNLEHVLPENPGDGWGHILPEVAAAYYRRIGNLVLLQATKNSIIGNSSFKDKRKVFI